MICKFCEKEIEEPNSVNHFVINSKIICDSCVEVIYEAYGTEHPRWVDD